MLLLAVPLELALWPLLLMAAVGAELLIDASPFSCRLFSSDGAENVTGDCISGCELENEPFLVAGAELPAIAGFRAERGVKKDGVPAVGVDTSWTQLSHPESKCALMSRSRTGLEQIGQLTMRTEGRRSGGPINQAVQHDDRGDFKRI